MKRDGESRYKRGAPSKSGGRISKTRAAWTTIGRMSVVIYAGYDEESEKDNEDEKMLAPAGLKPIRLTFLFPGTPAPRTINLTGLTEDELLALRKVIDAAFDAALPTCQMLDQQAKEAQENGDDAFARLYRQVPDIVVREGVLPELPPVLSKRSDEVR